MRWKRLPLSLVWSVLASQALAQQYPMRTIRAIVPFGPGGASDIVMRSLAPEVAKPLGQQVIVENRPGANTAIGADVCAKAAPDGYTVCLLPIDSISINPFLFRKLSYDPERDLEPVLSVFANVNALMVNPTVKANTLAELISLARTNPGTLNYSSPASFVQIFIEGFNKASGVDIRHVPYKGGGDAIKALLGDEVQVSFVAIANVLGLIRSGKVRILAVDAAARSPLLPEVPTLTEAGYKGFPFRAWYGVFVPRGTPAPIVARLNADFGGVLADPEVRDKVLVARGLEPLPMSPGQFAQYLKEDRVRAGELVKQSGIQIE